MARQQICHRENEERPCDNDEDMWLLHTRTHGHTCIYMHTYVCELRTLERRSTSVLEIHVAKKDVIEFNFPEIFISHPCFIDTCLLNW